MNVHELLSPEAIRIVKAVADHGSMAAAARALNVVPSAVTYRVRQIEDALDVLLFDRSAREARITAAGEALLREGERVLQELEAVARRVQRVASGWEPQLTIAVDSIIAKHVVLELCEAFFALEHPRGPATRIRLRDETLSGTWDALIDGKADLAIGVVVESSASQSVASKPLGDVGFVFAVAPQHPLAKVPEPLSDEAIAAHRIVAVADSTSRAQTVSVGILSGQDVLTVASMQAKLDAQLRGLGCGFLPECVARPFVKTGRLIAKATQRTPRVTRVSYAWHAKPKSQMGLALRWWLAQLEARKTREALLHASFLG